MVHVAEPRARPAGRVVVDGWDRARAGGLDLGEQFARREVEQAQRADAVPGVEREHCGPIRGIVAVEPAVITLPAAVDQGEILQHRLRVFRQHVAPLLVGEGVRVGGAQPQVRGVAIGAQVELPVVPEVHVGLRVHTLLHRDPARLVQAGRGQIRDVQVVAGRSAAIRIHRDPAAVARDDDGVVVRLVQSVAEHERVLGRVGAEPVQVDAAVVLRLVVGHEVRGEPARVVEGLAVRQPRDLRVAAAVDRAVHEVAGGHVDHPQQRLLGAALRQQVRQQPAVARGVPAVERRRAGGVDGSGVDQRALDAVLTGRQQHGVLLAGRAAREETLLAAPDRGSDDARVGQFGESVAERLALIPVACQRILERGV